MAGFRNWTPPGIGVRFEEKRFSDHKTMHQMNLSVSLTLSAATNRRYSLAIPLSSLFANYWQNLSACRDTSCTTRQKLSELHEYNNNTTSTYSMWTRRCPKQCWDHGKHWLTSVSEPRACSQHRPATDHVYTNTQSLFLNKTQTSYWPRLYRHTKHVIITRNTDYSVGQSVGRSNQLYWKQA